MKTDLDRLIQRIQATSTAGGARLQAARPDEFGASRTAVDAYYSAGFSRAPAWLIESFVLEFDAELRKALRDSYSTPSEVAARVASDLREKYAPIYGLVKDRQDEVAIAAAQAAARFDLRRFGRTPQALPAGLYAAADECYDVDCVNQTFEQIALETERYWDGHGEYMGERWAGIEQMSSTHFRSKIAFQKIQAAVGRYMAMHIPLHAHSNERAEQATDALYKMYEQSFDSMSAQSTPSGEQQIMMVHEAALRETLLHIGDVLGGDDPLVPSRDWTAD